MYKATYKQVLAANGTETKWEQTPVVGGVRVLSFGLLPRSGKREPTQPTVLLILSVCGSMV